MLVRGVGGKDCGMLAHGGLELLAGALGGKDCIEFGLPPGG